MKIIKSVTILVLIMLTCRCAVAGEQSEAVVIHEGTGSFSMTGGVGREDKIIEVYYHRPAGFDGDSPILIVIPGTGRDGDAYRDAWTNASEQYDVLVLSPAYQEQDYDFAAYHLGGTVTDLELRNLSVDEHARIYRIDDDDIQYDINTDPSRWLFQDFDRLFDIVASAVGSRQTGYDLFGHSAGGQILHRLAIFYPDNRANRILASNSGFYTLPRFDIRLPFGIHDTPITNESLKRSFRNKLVLFLGATDDEHEIRGSQLHTPLADQQGLGRLARGWYFYEESRKTAAALDTRFNWTIEVVPGVGHDFRLMSQAAARYLYNSGRSD